MAKNETRILVPIKEGKTGEDAFRLACRLCNESKAKIYALYVIEIGRELPLDAEVDPEVGEAILHRVEAVGREEKREVDAEYLQARHAGPAIVQEALQRQVELIVLGIPYKRRFGQFTLGETATYVLKNARCPVILCREQAGAASSTGG